MLIKLDDDDYANYQLRLQTAEGQELLRHQTGKEKFGKDRAFVTLTVPSGKLNKGDYILVLFGRTADGRTKEIDRYFFQVS